MNVLLFMFRELLRMTLLSITILAVLQKKTLFSCAAASLAFLALNATKPNIFFSCVKRQFRAWWSSKVKEAARKRCNIFASVHQNGESSRGTSQLLVMLCLSLAKLRHGMKHAPLFLLNQSALFFDIQLVLLPFSLHLTFATALLPGSWHWFTLTT